MKRSRNRIAGVIAFLVLSAVVYSADATVNGWDIPVAKKPGGDTVVGTLPPCANISVEQISGPFARIRSGDLRGWVRSRDIVLMEKIFSNTKTSGLLSRKIVLENGKHYLYYANTGRLVKYNLTERIADSSQKVGDVASLVTSPRSDYFLLEGVVRDGEEIHNYVIHHFPSGRTVALGSFSGARVVWEDAKFSESGRYLAAVAAVDGLYYICVYASDSGQLVAGSRRGRQVNWIGETLVLNNTEAFWSVDASSGFPEFDIGTKPDRIFAKVQPDWVVQGRVESRPLDGEILIRTPGGVLAADPKGKKIRRTSFRGILLNPDRTLEFTGRGVRSLKTGGAIRIFSGESPTAEFQAFASTNIIGRSRFEKISTLFLYSAGGQEIYRYKSVDDPEAVSDSGIVADLATEKDMTILSVEDPWTGQFHLIVERD